MTFKLQKELLKTEMNNDKFIQILGKIKIRMLRIC